MSRFSRAQRAAIISASAMVAGAVGLLLGQPLAYQFARVVDRDPAEIKDAFVWCILAAPVVAAAAGALTSTVALRSTRWRAATWTLLGTTVLSVLTIYHSYEPLKTFGTPVIDYELLLPEGMQIRGIGGLDITVWNGVSGQGCYIESVEHSTRPKIRGSLVLKPTNYEPVLSIAFHNGERWQSGGQWPLPYRPDANLETSFGPWQGITFKNQVHGLPLATGRFEIRYRVSRYI